MVKNIEVRTCDVCGKEMPKIYAELSFFLHHEYTNDSIVCFRDVCKKCSEKITLAIDGAVEDIKRS